ncbi:hypothetical protein [Sphaerotilus sp.]|uniref:hypothetical protein n=1 Tax=Sphaerotilus sp. TaxID=2093942 RepID=UPI002ACDCCE4|nr:hypothetical protein [Sphaerotilus sp.]MDZ7855421.1 hypothetical protein [Sphaerotilus sp.]
MVAATDHRCAQVHAAVARLPGDLQVERADTVVDALLRSARRPAELLLLDFAVDDAFAPIVVRHLARVSPLTTVMLFDDLARTVSGHPSVLDWKALGACLQRWWQSRPLPRSDLDAASPTPTDDPA